MIKIAFFLLSLFSLKADEKAEVNKSLNLFNEVFQRVLQNYVHKVSPDQLIESALKGMLTSLDKYSSYITPTNLVGKNMRLKGEYEGIGLEMISNDNIITVVTPFDNTPAYQAGIQPGDIILEINGTPVAGCPLDKAVEMLRGKPGTEISLKMHRKNYSPYNVTLKREKIRIRTVRDYIFNDVGYIRITQFNEKTTSMLFSKLNTLKQKLGDRFKGLIIDLRNNPGGLFDQAIAVANLFLDGNEIVYTKGREEGDIHHYFARPGDVIEGLPMVVLTNKGTASAAEILAAALQENKRALILGTESFKKGSMQLILPLPNQGAIKITTARYYTPSGKLIEERGIKPDVKVDMAMTTSQESSNDSNNLSPAKIDKDAPAKDAQLSHALDLINAINIYNLTIKQ